MRFSVVTAGGDASASDAAEGSSSSDSGENASGPGLGVDGGPNDCPDVTGDPTQTLQHTDCSVPFVICHYPGVTCMCAPLDAGFVQWQCSSIFH